MIHNTLCQTFCNHVCHEIIYINFPEGHILKTITTCPLHNMINSKYIFPIMCFVILLCEGNDSYLIIRFITSCIMRSCFINQTLNYKII